MPSKNPAVTVIFMAVLTSRRMTESFQMHREDIVVGARTRRRVASRTRSTTRKGCRTAASRSSSSSSSSHVSGDSDGCDFCNITAFAEPNPFIPIHISRRRFIKLAAATTTVAGISSFSTSSAQAIDDADSLFAPYQKQIITIGGPLPPFSTTRSYRNIVLSNGLKVVLVQDSLVQRSSVALSIDGAGQFSEPDPVPGLAHLMEHIVLSSTRFSGKKILERRSRFSDRKRSNINSSGEEAFEDWLIENDGDSNAFTAPGFVCFHFTGPHEVRSF